MMELTVQFTDAELERAIKIHMSSGLTVQNFFKAAMAYFEYMLKQEQEGYTIGYSQGTKNADYFRRYNNEFSPFEFLHKYKAEHQ